MKSIKNLRSRFGLTQTEFAKKIGMSKTSVVYIENDKTHTLSPKYLKKICDTFGVTATELFIGTNNLKYKPKTKEELGKYIQTLQEEYENWE